MLVTFDNEKMRKNKPFLNYKNHNFLRNNVCPKNLKTMLNQNRREEYK